MRCFCEHLVLLLCCFSIANRHSAHARYLNFFGQPEARLDSNQSIFGPINKQCTWLNTVASILLLFTQEGHLNGTI